MKLAANQDMKFCTGCKTYHPATADVFGKDNRTRDGLKNPCKEARKRLRGGDKELGFNDKEFAFDDKQLGFDDKQHVSCDKNDKPSVVDDKTETKPTSNDDKPGKTETKRRQTTTNPIGRWLWFLSSSLVFLGSFSLRVKNAAIAFIGTTTMITEWDTAVAVVAAIVCIGAVAIGFRSYLVSRGDLSALITWIVLEALALGIDGVGVVRQLEARRSNERQSAVSARIEQLDAEFETNRRIADRFQTRRDDGSMVTLRSEARRELYPALKRMREIARERGAVVEAGGDRGLGALDWLLVVAWVLVPIFGMLVSIRSAGWWRGRGGCNV